MNKLFAIVVLLILAGGGWYAYQNSNGGDAETLYAYTCTDGVQFSLAPAEDLSWAALIPGENAPFAQQSLAFVDSVDGMKYSGSDVGFIGRGEDIELIVRGASTSCSQAADAKKWNWDGSAGGVESNLALTVTHSIAGSWRSTDDAKFVRTFRGDGTFADTYGGQEVAHGLWVVFTEANAPETPFPLQENRAYIQLADSDGAVMYFQITSMNFTTLSMIYMDRGGVLNFVLVQE